MVDGNNIMQMLEHPEEYIDSEKYFSWERYFTAILIQVTQNSYLRYAKNQLNAVYLQEKVEDKILAVIKEISLK